MDNLPDRPNPHAHLRASDIDRDQVVDVLRDALMAGRLTQEEHADRLEQTLQARTLGELEPITSDLIVAGPQLTPLASSAPARTVSNSPVPIEEPANPDDSFTTMVAIFGGGERKGAWRVKRRTNVFAVFGGHDLDMTHAVFEGREVTVWTFAVFGGIDLTVPDGVTVRNEGIGIFGGFGFEGDTEPHPDAPTVVIKGLALFGGVGGRNSSKRHGKKKKGHGQLGHGG
ncbi:DUF1707 and DUF2154 domain-containing protein [Kribbella sandramycini]|uniref:DUF1707 and DUF2154 domain-containing protein n=1 Tax=Kribbella sandramycini TaxID=60450 RepID=A0A7Y4L6F6_9ACTN|nr:DUF1707 domain-containing protein [Kribbella sandramycini]MBB6571647.1 hypothetical protein [Kribbella sandramycini]NOL44292.1 DUF1707 and DUF2154 domain-containing protein [Kribbella sandramycini]